MVTNVTQVTLPARRADIGEANRPPKAQRRDIRVEYEVVHPSLRQIRLALSVVPGEERVQLLIGVERALAHEIIH